MPVGDQARDLSLVGAATVGLDDAGRRADLRRRGFGHPEDVGEGGPLGGGGGLPGESQEDRALSFAQIIARGLSGHRGVSENAEVVVA